MRRNRTMEAGPLIVSLNVMETPETRSIPSDAAEEGAWIRGACVGAPGTVGSLVPDGFASIIRLSAPDPMVGNWIAAYRDLFRFVASVGRSHTNTPTRAWFAMEEANEFGLVAPAGPDAFPIRRYRRGGDHEARSPREARERVSDTAAARAWADAPVLSLPRRSYRIASDSIGSVAHLRGPRSARSWRHPELFWPADRSWFVATDVDFWSLYVAGSDALTTSLSTRCPTPHEFVTAVDRLVAEE